MGRTIRGFGTLAIAALLITAGPMPALADCDEACHQAQGVCGDGIFSFCFGWNDPILGPPGCDDFPVEWCGWEEDLVLSDLDAHGMVLAGARVAFSGATEHVRRSCDGAVLRYVFRDSDHEWIAPATAELRL